MSQQIPGSVLIIDDKFKDIILSQKTEDTEMDNNELEQLCRLFSLFIKEGIPILIFSSDDMTEFEDFVNKTHNVRVVVLDLDIDGDGVVGDKDKSFIKEGLIKMFDKYGYFFIIIYSAYSEVWEDEIWNDIKNDDSIPENIKKIPESMILSYNKNDKNVLEEIINKIRELPSLSVILTFENELKRSLDGIAGRFVEFENNTWKSIIHNIKNEVGDLWEYELVQLLLGLIKHNIKKKDLFGSINQDSQSDVAPEMVKNVAPEMVKKIYRALNYIDNLPVDPVYTGNLYRTDNKDSEKEYALVITPECDIAQNKNDNKFTVIYGTDNIDKISEKRKKTKKKTVQELNEEHKVKKDYLYTLKFPIEDRNVIVIDFRFVETIEINKIKNWTFLGRVNDPMITDIMDKFSNLFNRKGLPSLLPKGMKIIDETDESK